ncbi:LIM/homeobox protein Lhx9-like protein [Leptotrombidium deliense]|uniref:LIM/homeobox protein Lhx9-like protein n=1 Tax=Leptotrombidium deliense TaxID=299467 RepID=A0A443SU22_9ACAR|nr:LIM/homeobox protein Lhx9-like protein [Leptotrombidium deliense]
MRTSFKHHQLRAMKNYFSYNQNPDAKDLKNLAHKTGLTKRVLQVWFQNARAKWRRNNNKQHDQVTGDGQPLSQKSLGGNSITGNPESPSTGIGSPGGSSTRPLSTPSPSIAAMIHEQSEMVPSNASNGSSLDQFPQISSSSCTMLRRSSSPPSHLSHSHHSHSHHSHQSGIHQTNGDSIIPALTSFQELF